MVKYLLYDTNENFVSYNFNILRQFITKFVKNIAFCKVLIHDLWKKRTDWCEICISITLNFFSFVSEISDTSIGEFSERKLWDMEGEKDVHDEVHIGLGKVERVVHGA